MSNREHSPFLSVTSGDRLATSTPTLNPLLEAQIPTLNLSSPSEQSELSQEDSADVERALQLEEDLTNYLVGWDFEVDRNPDSEMEAHEPAWAPRVYCSKDSGCIAENHCMIEERQLKWDSDCFGLVADFREELTRRLEARKTQAQANARGPVGLPRGYSTERGVKKVAWFSEDMVLIVRTPREERDHSSSLEMSAASLLEQLDDLSFMGPGSTITRADGAEYWFECVASHR